MLQASFLFFSQERSDGVCKDRPRQDHRPGPAQRGGSRCCRLPWRLRSRQKPVRVGSLGCSLFTCGEAGDGDGVGTRAAVGDLRFQRAARSWSVTGNRRSLGLRSAVSQTCFFCLFCQNAPGLLLRGWGGGVGAFSDLTLCPAGLRVCVKLLFRWAIQMLVPSGKVLLSGCHPGN